MADITNQDILNAIRGLYQSPNRVVDNAAITKLQEILDRLNSTIASNIANWPAVQNVSDADVLTELEFVKTELEAIKTRLNSTLDVKIKSTVKDAFNGNTNTTKTYESSMTGFYIANDGNTELSFTIGSITISVLPGEVFDGIFDPFTSVSIVASEAFRALVKG